MTSALGDRSARPVVAVAPKSVVVTIPPSQPATRLTDAYRRAVSIGTCLLLVGAGVAIGVWATLR